MKQIATMNAVQTMTSREIAELTGKQHRNVTRDIDNMIDSMRCSDLSNQIKSTTYVDGSGVDRRQYELDKEMTMTLVTGYSIPLRHAVIKRWQQLENSTPNYDTLPSKMIAESTLLECAARVMNLAPSAIQQGMKYIASKNGLDEGLIPDYVDDGQQAHHSATELLKSSGASISAKSFNKLLEAEGFITSMTRKSSSSKGGVKKFWVITEKGLGYGKNLAHKSSGGRETQPYWRDDKFIELMKAVGA